MTRLLQFSGVLASENKQRLSLNHWDLLVKEYFAHNAVMKFTLWKDNQRNEAKPFGLSHFSGFTCVMLTKWSRYWRPDIATVFSGDGTVWCEVNVTFIGWRTRAAALAKPRCDRMRDRCLDLQIHKRLHGDITRTTHGSYYSGAQHYTQPARSPVVSTIHTEIR